MLSLALDNLPPVTQVEQGAPAQSRPAGDSSSAGSFDSYMKRAQSQGTAADNSVSSQNAGKQDQSKSSVSSQTNADRSGKEVASQASQSDTGKAGNDSSGAPQGQTQSNRGDQNDSASGNADSQAKKDSKSKDDGTAATIDVSAAALAVIAQTATPLPVVQTQAKPAAAVDKSVAAKEVNTKASAPAATDIQATTPEPSTDATCDASSGKTKTSDKSDSKPVAGPNLQTAATGVAVSQPAVATASAALPTDDAAKPADDPNDDVAPLSAQTIVAQAGQSVQPTSSGQANSVGQPAAEAFSSSIAAANRSMTLASAATNVSDDNLRPLADKTKPADGADSGKVAVSDPTTSQSNVPMHLSVNKASQADSPSAATTTDDVGQAGRVRFVQRVEQAFQSMSDQGGTVRLKLSPPELGSMRLEITVRNGVMTARAETETPAGRNMLLDNLPMLRERLAQQDIKVQRFDIDLMDHSGGGASGQASYFADSQAHSGNGRSGQASAAAGVDSQTVGAAGAATGLGEGNQLNVIV